MTITTTYLLTYLLTYVELTRTFDTLILSIQAAWIGPFHWQNLKCAVFACAPSGGSAALFLRLMRSI